MGGQFVGTNAGGCADAGCQRGDCVFQETRYSHGNCDFVVTRLGCGEARSTSRCALPPPPPPPSLSVLHPPSSPATPLQIFSSMSHVLTSADVSHGKPSPDIFIAAANRLGADCSACIAFEDSPHGVTSGARRRPRLQAHCTSLSPHGIRSLRRWNGVRCNPLPHPTPIPLRFRSPLPRVPLPPSRHRCPRCPPPPPQVFR